MDQLKFIKFARRWFVDRRSERHLVMIVLCSTSLLAGCQSFKPISTASQKTVASARQWTRGGVAALRSVQSKQSRTFFSRASAQDPIDKTVHANLTRAASQQGDSQQAIEQMHRAVELAGNEPKLIVELGEMYLTAGQWLPAKRQSELALSINHRFAPGWALQAKTYLAKGNLDAALADFQRAAGLDPGLPGVQLAIIDIYRRKQQPLRALAAVEQLLNQYPPDQQPERVLLAKGVALMELRQLGPAIEVLQTASNREAASSEVYLRLGQAQLLAGQVSQARLTLNLGKESFPGDGEFDSLLTELQSAQQRLAAVDAQAIR